MLSECCGCRELAGQDYVTGSALGIESDVMDAQAEAGGLARISMKRHAIHFHNKNGRP
jgi:hypothetical protein